MKNSIPAPQDFAPAPAGTRVRWTTILTFGLGAVLPAFIYLITRSTGATAVVPIILVGAGLSALFFLIWALARVKRYRLEARELLVEIGSRKLRFPLGGLRSAERDATVFKGAYRSFGNSGLGSICGRFSSPRLSQFRAFVTDVDKAIVLRWPDRCLVVSPESSQSFLEAVRRHIEGARL